MDRRNFMQMTGLVAVASALSVCKADYWTNTVPKQTTELTEATFLHLTIDTRDCKEFMHTFRNAKHKAEICLVIDGKKTEMTLAEFKQRLS
jgi:16S rRNA C1402 (ribose-2'-O) methylase RsmI